MDTLLTERRIGVAEASAAMRRRFVSDCLLFDLADEGRIVACRCPMERFCGGESVHALLDEETREALHDRLLAYDLRPMAVETARGRGYLLFSLAPSAALCALLIPERGADGSAELEREIEEFLCCGHTVRDRALLWSGLAGCPISFFGEDAGIEGEELDGGLLDAFLLIAFLLCRRISSARMATVRTEQRLCGITVSVRIPIEGIADAREDAPEVLFLRALGDRRRIPLDYTVSEGFLDLNVTPLRPDWSYLTIKQPEDETVWERLLRETHEET